MDEDLARSVSEEQVWGRFRRAVRKNARQNGSSSAYLLIHFARYENRFLHSLQEKYGTGHDIPMSSICSHQITRKLLPGLPRKGLRAVAGYFGISVSPERRSSIHVDATALLWPHLVDLLEDREKVYSVDELLDWLRGKGVNPPSTREYPMDPEARLNLPDLPGIYRMLRSNGDLLYVGKAKSLKRRVNSYFQKKGRHSEHVLEMLSQARSLEFTPVDSALEAALLESDEIKRLSPPYNKALLKKERAPVFLSRDLSSAHGSPDEAHPVGPIPSRKYLVPLRVIIQILIREIPTLDLEESAPEIFGIKDDKIPDRDCFVAGWKMFEEMYLTEEARVSPLETLMRLGGLFWKEKQEEELVEDLDKEEEESVEEERGELIWTPDLVFRALKSVVRQGVRVIRQSRWLCQLSEGILVWDSNSGEGGRRNLLILHKGIPEYRSIESDSPVRDLPEIKTKSMRERQCSFDLLTYDRLRVLNTELRRLVREGCRLELYLKPDKFLDRESLERVLKWV